jgi:hypothetical protein
MVMTGGYPFLELHDLEAGLPLLFAVIRFLRPFDIIRLHDDHAFQSIRAHGMEISPWGGARAGCRPR